MIVPDFQEIRRFFKQNGIPTCPDGDLILHEQAQELIKREVDEVNATLPHHERIQYYTVLRRSFSIESGELTPTLKLKRRVIFEKFHDEIARMYVN